MIITDLVKGLRTLLSRVVAIESLQLLHVLQVQLGLQLAGTALSCLGGVWRDRMPGKVAATTSLIIITITAVHIK